MSPGLGGATAVLAAEPAASSWTGQDAWRRGAEGARSGPAPAVGSAKAPHQRGHAHVCLSITNPCRADMKGHL